jgi:hypothetical protein
MGLQSAATGLFRFSGTLTSGVGQQGVSGGQHIEGSPRKGPVDLTVEQTVAASYGKEITDSVERRLEAWMSSPTFGSGETRNYWFDDDGFHFNNLSIISSYVSSSNIDSIWHDDAANAWNFCSDTTLRAAGNSTLVGAKSSMGLGTALLPSFFFTGDPNTGVYSAGADSFGVTVGGTVRRTITTGSETATLVQLGPDGSVSAPAYSFSDDTDTGIYSDAANSMSFATGGTQRLDIDSGGIKGKVAFLAPDGSAGAPGLSFDGDTDTGIYSVGANSVGVTVGGTVRRTVTTASETATLVQLGPDGSAAAPGYSFSGDPDTGIYRSGTNALSFSTGNATRMTIASGGGVGIGTTSPGQTLQVSGSLAVTSKMVTGQASFTQEPWNASTIALGAYGSIGTQGSYRASLAWNYERGTDTGWHALGINSYSSAAGIDLGNDGIRFRADTTYGASNQPTTRMIMTPAGKVGIGTASPAELLHVGDGSTAGTFRVHASGGAESFRVVTNVVRSSNIVGLTTAAGANVYISSGNKSLYMSTSSARFKSDVEDLEDDYADRVLAMRPVWFRSATGNDPETYSYYGLIAEEVAEIDPRLVNFGPTPACDCPEDPEDPGVVVHSLACCNVPTGVQYDRLVPHLISVAQRQADEIAALTARLSALEPQS